MNIVDTVRKFARIHPRSSAFIEVRPVTGVRDEISWEDFEKRTNRLARCLRERGAEKNKKIFLLGRNSLRWLEAYFSILKTGAWVVPLNFRFTDNDIKYCANVAEPHIFIFDDEYAERTVNLRKELPTIKHYITMGEDRTGVIESLEDILRNTAISQLNIALSDEDNCALYFTSGTTGAPKPVLLTLRCLMASAVTSASNHNFNYTDRFIMMAPLYHLAIGHLLGAILGGACTILLTEKINPQNILRTIAQERATVVFLLVPWAIDLLDYLEGHESKKDHFDLSCWRQTFMGAQPIPPVLIQRFKKHFPNMEFDNIYGLSETAGPGVIHLGIANERKIGAIGKPSLTWDARIVDEHGQDVKRGDVGEIILKGIGMMKGYYKNPDLTSQVVRNGWLYTGDLGRIDEEGFIYLVDRKKDLVITGGENVYPAEVEDVIRKHQMVYDVAIIGTPNERLGEIVTAIIQLKSRIKIDEHEMESFCEQRLPRYKRPRRIIFGEVPRNAAGKIEKRRLREKHCGRDPSTL